MSKEERAKLIHPLMYALDVKAHQLYWVSDDELLSLLRQSTCKLLIPFTLFTLVFAHGI